MQNNYGFATKRVYPSEEGLHFEHYTQEEAEIAYIDALGKGANVELNGIILTWKFNNSRKSSQLNVNFPA